MPASPIRYQTRFTSVRLMSSPKIAVNPQIKTIRFRCKWALTLALGIAQQINSEDAKNDVWDPDGYDGRKRRFLGQRPKDFVEEDKRERQQNSDGEVDAHSAATLH